LGLKVSSFHDIGKSVLAFYSSRAAQIAQDNKNTTNNDYNNQIQEQYSTYYGHIDQQYEQERFTDDNAYSEYFQEGG
jgi:hypothetical protein